MTDFWNKFFDTTYFMPHGHCYLWRPDILWLNVISDGLIALAYFSIPISLVYFVSKRKDLEFNWMFKMFAVFIVACGMTHVFDVWSVWNPSYGTAGLIKLFTAIMSTGTAVLLWPLMPKALAIPSPSQLKAKNAELLHQIEERRAAQAELARKNEKLVEAERLKGEFLANISHELRTPLSLILAPVESLLAETKHAPKERLSLCTIENNAKRLLLLVNDLLDFSKLEAKKIAPDDVPTNLAQFLEVIVNDFEPAAIRKNIKLHFQVDNFFVSNAVLTDQHLLERIVFNLLANALKFTNEGGTVSVALKEANDQLSISVTDTGLGISSENLEAIFERFRQVKGSYTRESEGTGLGLALAKEFTELLGGNITAKSQMGQGSEFTVTLPLRSVGEFVQTTAAEERIQPVLPIDLEGNKERFQVDGGGGESADVDRPKLLIVEDNLELAAYIETTVQDMCIVAKAKSGAEGLTLAAEWHPDFVISDVMMPHIDGYELCRRIKSNFETSTVPVFLLTALSHDDAVVRGFEAGADDYIPKPFHYLELRARVKSIIASVNARKEVNKALIDYNQRLELEVQERTTEIMRLNLDLQQQRDQAEAANRAKTAFLANMSHEIRTPLGAVMGFSELVANSDMTPSDRINYVETIRRNGELLSKIINDILDISKIEVGRLDIEKSDVSLGEILTDVTSLLNLKAVEKGIHLSVVSRGNLPHTINTDAMRLRQILLNVIGNAIKFTEKGSIEIEIKQVAHNDNQLLSFAIKDTGPGLDDNDKRNLFKPFVQADSSLTRKFGGTGLGLALSKRLAGLLGGDVELTKTRKGAGSTFTVTIDPGSQQQILFQNTLSSIDRDRAPLSEPVYAPKPSSFDKQPLKRTRILIAEDSTDNQELIRFYLRKAGATFDICSNGNDAIRMALDSDYDVILMDIQMPEKDGFEATIELRARGFAKPIVALTAHALKADVERMLENGFNAHIAKPIKLDKMLNTLLCLLEKR
ncbi:MAG: ATP-binding protein [Oligoflexales bacterium]